VAIVAGTLSNLTVNINPDPGDAPDAYTFTVMRNGAEETAQQCTITAPAQSCADATGSVVFGNGDDISVRSVEANTAADVQVSWSAQYTLP